MTTSNFSTYQLSPKIEEALTAMHYTEPTEVQQKVIPKVLDKKDVIVKSQTGSGKTAAFVIPTCENIIWEENKPQAIILTPTRELAVQVCEEVTSIGRYKRIKAVSVYGKEPIHVQINQLKQKTHVVVGTPGRMVDHLERGTLDVSHVKYVIIDEADEMLNMGFIDTVNNILQQLPRERVTMLFSATLPVEIEQLCQQYMKTPEKIEISTKVTTDTISHAIVHVEKWDKLDVLKDMTIVENPDSCIIFCNTKVQVNEVYEQLHKADYACQFLHGDLEQKERFYVMNGFKEGKFRYLIATDVAARGLDIDSISLVINYDIPFEKETYVHRIGRTGRAGKNGKAITFMEQREEKYLEAIEAYIGYALEETERPSKRLVQQSEEKFYQKMNKKRTVKQSKQEKINKDIMKLYFNGGKKKKLRAVDFVGTLSNIEGMTADDIGIISISDTMTYVDILNGKGPLVLKEMEDRTIKGKQLKVRKANK